MSEKLPKPNLSNLFVRIATGTVYVSASVLCVLWNSFATMVMFAVLAGVCAGEFYYMLRSSEKLPNEVLGIIAAVSYPVSVYFFNLGGALIVTVVFLVALLFWYVFFQEARVSDVGVSFFGAAYCGLLLTGGIIVRMSLPDPQGAWLLLLIMISVWANDSFAYVVGSRLGRHKMAPKISPNKSWEGLVAGLFGSVIVWVAISFIPGVDMSIALAVCFGILSGLSGVLGDLAESRIKRNSGFKDSGTIMPGHGGLLDRCDSLFLVLCVSVLALVFGGCIPYVI